MDKSPETPPQKVQRLAQESLSKSDPTAWFDQLYQDANGDEKNIPWAKLTPHFALENWLNSVDFSPTNKTTLVVGCGLGDDAEFLANFGFQVVAFDISPTAISWCKKRFPNSSVNYQVADVFSSPQSWKNAFDFVVESRTIQALPLTVRETLIAEIASFVKNQGFLFIISRLREQDPLPVGPPWPLSWDELKRFEKWGFQSLDYHLWTESESPNIPQIRLVYQRL